MAIPISTLENFKIETEFGDGFVVHTTYEWEFSTRRLKESSRWNEVKIIGSGAFGSVWLEKKELGGELRAVKRLQRGQLIRTGFSQELLALITVADHKHLFVEFYGWYETRHDIFLAMEYVKYGDLSEYMKDRQTARETAGEVTRQILEGLQILHGEGICHRDLKPQNILVASRDPIWVKLADFGVSKRTNNTVLRTICGTRGYLAPEIQGVLPRRFRTGEQFSYALDLWSLGCVVHELLTSQIPFLESNEECDDMTGLESAFTGMNAEVDIEMLCEYCRGEIDFPSEILQASQVPDDGIEFVKSLLVANPRERATAASALQNEWVNTSNWYEDIQKELLGLGLHLDHKTTRESMKHLSTGDIARVLPTTSNLAALLEQALCKGYDITTTLLFRSPSRQLWDRSGTESALMHVVTYGEVGLLKRLTCMDIEVYLASDHLITCAGKRGRTEIVRYLLARGADASARDGDGWTVLQTASGGGYIEVVQLILDNNADINAKPCDWAGRTALQAASGGGHIEVVRLLLDNNADVNAKPTFDIGRTALQAASGGGHIEVVQLLLDNNADVNAKPSDTDGRTALQAASGGGHIEVVRLLLDNNADVNAEPTFDIGRTALQAASGGGHTEVVQLLLDNKADIDAKPSYLNGRTAVQAASGGGHIEVVQLLLDNNADVNVKPGFANGRTALQAASGGGYIEVVRLLLDNNADVNAEPSDMIGRTALQAASGGGHIEVVQLLLDNKADVDAKPCSWRGLTALQAASGGGHIDIVRLLLVNKANVNAEPSTHDGQTALQAAKKGGYSLVVQLLLDNGAKE